jgi:2,4-dienoyl-CoA reductase-like NADH-dependent reductase (Old Yellow Enzyme family)
MRDGERHAAHPRLFEPLTIDTFEVRNRIVHTAYHTAVSEEPELRFPVERARGGAVLIGLFGSNGSGIGGIASEMGPACAARLAADGAWLLAVGATSA